MIVYYDQSIFMQDKFFGNSIYHHSAISNIQADEYRPNWFKTKIRRDLLADEADYF